MSRVKRLIHEIFPRVHGIEEKFKRVKAFLVAVGYESSGLEAEVAGCKMRQGSSYESPVYSFAFQRFLPYESAHLRQVDVAASCAAYCHYDGGVQGQVLLYYVACLVGSLASKLQYPAFKQHPRIHAGGFVFLAFLVFFDKHFHGGIVFPRNFLKLLFAFFADVLVAGRYAESLLRDDFQRKARNIVDKVPGSGVGIFFFYGVYQLALLFAEGVVVYDALLQGSVLYFHGLSGSGCIGNAEVLWQYVAEYFLARVFVFDFKVFNAYCREKLCRLPSAEFDAVLRQKERAGYVVVLAGDDRLAVSWGPDMILHRHQHLGLCARLLGLGNVYVHLVPVEVRVVRYCHGKRKPYGPVRHYSGLVRHHAHPVQRRLPVDYHDVPVVKVPFHYVARHYFIGHVFLVFVRYLLSDAIRPYHVVCPGMGGHVPYYCAHALNIVGGDPCRDGKLLGYLKGYADFAYRYPWVGRNDGTRREVHPFSAEVASEAPFLLAEPLDKCLEGPAGTMARRRKRRDFIAHQGRNVVLQQLPYVRYYEVRSSKLEILS